MDATATALLLLPLGLGLLGFLEPCSIGSSLILIKYLEGQNAISKLAQVGIFTVTRAIFIDLMGVVAVAFGTAFLGMQRIAWVLLGAIYAAAMAPVLWPLRRKSIAEVAAGANDVAVYRDQLDEIERDRAAGTIGAAEAEAARVEVSRRLIAAADNEPTVSDIGRDRTAAHRHRLATAGAVVAVPAGVVGPYLAVGSPNLPDQPLADRVGAAQGGEESIETLFARVEAHLEQHPDDGRGWEAIAPAYMRLGRYDDAVSSAWTPIVIFLEYRHLCLAPSQVLKGLAIFNWSQVGTTAARRARAALRRLDNSSPTHRANPAMLGQQNRPPGRRRTAPALRTTCNATEDRRRHEARGERPHRPTGRGPPYGGARGRLRRGAPLAHERTEFRGGLKIEGQWAHVLALWARRLLFL